MFSGVVSPNRRNFRQALFHDISGPDRIEPTIAVALVHPLPASLHPHCAEGILCCSRVV
jgi:hypothetical protein